MSDLVLTYLISLLSAAALPLSVIIVASWRVARLRQLTMASYQERVDESVAETIKEQLSDRLLTPLLNSNLPPGRTAYDIIDRLVPGNDIELLSSIYTDLAQLGIQSEYYLQLLQVIHSFW